MILYHFTKFYFLENGGTILKEGLKPSIGEEDNLPPHGAVWLTTDEDYEWHEGKSSQLDDCRIRLAIPSHDRRLVHWPKWLCKHSPETIYLLLVACDCGRDHRPSMNATYVYFGPVPLTHFRAIEYADPVKRAAFERDEALGKVQQLTPDDIAESVVAA
jgi:hypothetical protein